MSAALSREALITSGVTAGASSTIGAAGGISTTGASAIGASTTGGLVSTIGAAGAAVPAGLTSSTRVFKIGNSAFTRCSGVASIVNVGIRFLPPKSLMLVRTAFSV